MSQNCSNWHKKLCPVSPLPRCGGEWWCHISCCMRGRRVSDVRPCPEQRVHYSEETTIINMPQFCVKTNGMLPVYKCFKKCLVLGTFFDVNRRTSATCSGQPAWSQGSGRSYGILIYQAYNITRGRGQNVALLTRRQQVSISSKLEWQGSFDWNLHEADWAHIWRHITFPFTL